MDAQDRAPWRRASVAYLAIAGVLLAILWGSLIRDLQNQLRSEAADARQQLQNVTSVGLHALESAVSAADLLLIDLRDGWARDPARFDKLVGARRVHPAYRFTFDITVIDREGRTRFSTLQPAGRAPDPYDLRGFIRLRGTARDALSVGPPRLAHERSTIDFARPLLTPDGASDGMVLCSVHADYLPAVFRAVDVGDGGVMAAVGPGGRVLMSIGDASNAFDANARAAVPPPQAAPALGRRTGSGYGRFAWPLDAKDRLVAWQTVPDYPLTLFVGRSSTALERTLQELRWRYVAAGGLVTSGLLVALYWLLRNQRLRERSARQQAAHVADLTRAQEALVASQSELRKLSTHQVAVREAERKHIAREIHDELGQRLTAHRMDLALLPETVREDPTALLAAHVEAMKADVDAMLKVARDIAGQMRPGALDIGLGPATETLLDQFGRNQQVRCELDNRLPPHFAMDDMRTTTAFRVVQEAVTNAARHANASWIRVALELSDGHLLLRVYDDGIGFDSQALPASGFGLRGMRERVHAVAGRIEVISGPGLGTTVEALLPVDSVTSARSAAGPETTLDDRP